jgi:IS5 family transposase
MKAHIGVDTEYGLEHSVIGMAINVHDVTHGYALLHGDEQVVITDSDYQGVPKRGEAIGVEWQVAIRPGKRKAQIQKP